ncbi:cGMP-dependent protein kinase 1 [Periophthalmus magnuspinnatus]|uniref:cGMP-dependent protein kinase 1 n=1 Tax=Periophthalmus magnuspinnatus TaxID=409849 RepID=UPI0024364A8F|nr:cGMP-dependent protein kinase 1 [Periophthalmus magnuspinnatus]
MGTLRDLQFALQLKIEELRQRDTLIDELELELDTKDELIRRLQEELDRYRATIPLPGPCTDSIAEEDDKHRFKRKTVISEPFTLDQITFSHKSPETTSESQKLIKTAFLKSDLLKHLGNGEINAIIATMYPTTINQGCYVFQEETIGSRAYVLEEGRLDMKKDGLKLQTIFPEEVFGELALLYNYMHSYSVSAQTDSKLWVIDRHSYQATLMQSVLNSLPRSEELLNSVPFLQTLPEDVIMKLSDLMEEMHFAEGEYILRQGTKGDAFYIITTGQVKVIEKKDSDKEEAVVSMLSEGQWFGEKALLREEVHTTNVIAEGDVTCLLIDRETFKDVTGELMTSLDESQRSQHHAFQSDSSDLASSLALNDFQVIRTLAIGEFGHVDLVQTSDKSCFAMRVLKKQLILSSGQQEHVLRERDILMKAHCPFIVRLFRTLQNADCLYMLTEVGAGGDLLSLLKEKGTLDDSSTRFYVACVVEGLTFLHCRGVIYRDVKPENVVLDEHGYGKLIGSGCLKKLDMSKKTWTFCGTPGYLAPEIILNQGHGVSADMWSLGVFVFELLSGRLPFCGFEPMMILTETIRGIDHLDFPKTISKSASSLIKRLCRNNPSERLSSQRNGAKDIHKHKWFEGFDWEALCRLTLPAPIVPKVNLPLDSPSSSHYLEDSGEFYTSWDEF